MALSYDNEEEEGDVFHNERHLPDDEPGFALDGNDPSVIIGTDGFVIFVSTCRSESVIRALGCPRLSIRTCRE